MISNIKNPSDLTSLAVHSCSRRIWNSGAVGWLPLLVVLSMPVTLQAQGTNFSGTDDFNDNLKNAAQWGGELVGGDAALTEANGRLEHTAPGIAGDEMHGWIWTANHGSYTQDWAVQVDVHLAALTLTDEQYANLNLAVFNADESANPIWQKDIMDVAIDRYGDGSTTVRNLEGNLAAYYAATPHDTGLLEVPNSTTDAALRISFNSTTKELSSWYDTNGATGGYNWTLLQKINIGSGTYTWDMTNSSTFSVALLGGSGGVTLSSGESYFDNFQAASLPAFTTQPPAATVTAGTAATFTVAASGTPPPTYRWQGSTDGGLVWNDLTNAMPYGNVTTGTLTVSNVTAAMSRYQFRCVASNSGGSVPSAAALLRVAPSILNFRGSDDFATGSNWSVPTLIRDDGGCLTFVSNRLEYTVSTSSFDDATLREWTTNVGSYTQDWAVQVDVHLASMSLTDGQYANLNLAVFNAAEATNPIWQTDSMDVAIDRYGNGSTTVHNFEGNLVAYYAAMPHNTGLLEVPNSATDAALRISFNSTTKELSSWHDANGATGGYNWTLLQKLNIGSGTYSWDMTNSSSFAVALIGGSGDVTLSAGQAYFDNFQAGAVAPPSPPYTYTTDTNNNSIAITGYTGSRAALTIPETINGLPVTVIGEGAFASRASLTSVTIPASVTSIGNSAFAGCSGLQSAAFMGNAPSLGTNVFSATASGFKVYYFNGKSGFTVPPWNGCATINMGAVSPVAPWLLSSGLPYDANLQADPNSDGVNHLMAYALNLDPNVNSSASLPRPVSAAGQMSLTFYAGNDDVTYRVESSTDLKVWSTVGVQVSAPDANKFRTATVFNTGPSRYIRLVAVH